MVLPGVLVVLISTVLIYLLGARLLSSRAHGATAALLFASTPLVWLVTQAGSRSLDQWPFLIGWLLSIERFRAEPNARHLVAAGGLLGLGRYSSVAAIVMMPICLAMTVVVLMSLGRLRIADPRMVALIAAFGVAAAPFAAHLAVHPEYLRDRILAYGLYDANRYNPFQGARELFSWVGLVARTEVYWDSFKPALLFLSGSSLRDSVMSPQVFLLPLAALMPIGFYRMASQPCTPAAWLCASGFAVAPLAAALTAQKPDPGRLIMAAPFAALVATHGIAQLLESRGRAARTAGILLPVCVLLCFGLFYGNMLGGWSSPH